MNKQLICCFLFFACLVFLTVEHLEVLRFFIF